MRLNPRAMAPKAITHEGAVVFKPDDKETLERLVMTTMLYENQFYVSGKQVADQIAALVAKLPAKDSLDIAIKGRLVGHLRHVPLFVLREVARKKKAVGLDYAIYQVCDRPDMVTDFLALYWKEKRCPLSNPVKRGLGMAMLRFNEYQLQKYNRPNAIKLRDIVRLTHPKPLNEEQGELIKRLLTDTLATPDTWEVALSKAHTTEEKRDTWSRLLIENKLGGLALLRNLRNITSAGVPAKLINNAFEANQFHRVLPFQFFQAAEIVPTMEPMIDKAMLKAVANVPKIKGKTIILVDVSGSMYGYQDKRSKHAAAVAVLGREMFTDVQIFTFSDELKAIPPRSGMALRDAINASQPHRNTRLATALMALPDYDRLIVITDEQANDNIPQAVHNKCYIINVASLSVGVGYLRGYHHIHGISDRVFDYILYHEDGQMLTADTEE